MAVELFKKPIIKDGENCAGIGLAPKRGAIPARRKELRKELLLQSF
jgi:hypothetical protein